MNTHFLKTEIKNFFIYILIGINCLVSLNCRSASAIPENTGDALNSLHKAIIKSSNSPSEDLLINFEKRFPRSEVAALACFRRGYNRYLNKDFVNAAEILSRDIIEKNSNLGAYALFYQGKALYEIGQTEHAIEVLLQIPSKYKESSMEREAILLVGKAATASNNITAAEKYLEPLLQKNDGTAFFILANAQEKTGHTEDAIKNYKHIYFEIPYCSESNTAYSKLLSLGAFSDNLSVDFKQWQTRAEKLFENKKYADATDLYTRLINAHPELLTSDNTKYQYGVGLFFTGKYRDAVATLGKVGTRRRELYADTLYYQYKAERQANLSTCTTTGEKFLSNYPKHPSAGEILADIAEYNEKHGNGAPYYARLIRDYPEVKTGEIYSFKRAWKTYQSGNTTASLKVLLEHVADFPSSDYKGMCAFWAAKSEEKLGNTFQAIQLYEAILRRYKYGYYGYLATQRLETLRSVNSKLKIEEIDNKSLLGRAINTIKPARPLPETAPEGTESDIKKASELRLIGLTSLAISELEILRQKAPQSRKINLELARIFRDQQDTLRAIQALQRAHPDYLSYQSNELTREEAEIFFPLLEWETIKQEAKRNSLDPYIVAGLIRQESVFNPQARSRSNALGLMQLLPSTGRLVAKKSGIDSLPNENLYNPKLNIKLGTLYLGDMVRKFGRYEYAFAAYNGGPGRVTTWLRTLPSEDIAVWVDSIPISETRLYVQGVLRNAAHYKRLYSE